jgi:putative transposase
VTIGTNPRAPVFADLVFGRECIEALRALADSRGHQVYVYCLMPDHVHLLIGVGAQESLIGFVQAWKSQCYRRRRTLGHPAVFWQRGFWDHALRTDEDIRAAALYILCNPVRKGLVDDFRAYPLCGSFVFELGD